LKDGQEFTESSKEDLRNYALQFIKSKMETDRLVGKNSEGLGNNEHILDGSGMKDYSLSFCMLVDMVDRTLDDYKSDLQQILFPIFTILYITMIRRNFEKGANQFFKEHEPLFKSNNSQYCETLVLLQSVKSP